MPKHTTLDAIADTVGDLCSALRALEDLGCDAQDMDSTAYRVGVLAGIFARQAEQIYCDLNGYGQKQRRQQSRQWATVAAAEEVTVDPAFDPEAFTHCVQAMSPASKVALMGVLRAFATRQEV
jgi:hypothetical protein